MSSPAMTVLPSGVTAQAVNAPTPSKRATAVRSAEIPPYQLRPAVEGHQPAAIWHLRRRPRLRRVRLRAASCRTTRSIERPEFGAVSRPEAYEVTAVREEHRGPDFVAQA